MPLLKKAQTPIPTAPATAPVATQTAVAPSSSVSSADIQPKSLDAKSRQIQRQGAFQAALQSVGVVQHGGKTFSDYLARVQEAADAELTYINR